MDQDENRLTLIPEKIQATTERLSLRIEDRFPGSGIANISRTLLDISRETKGVLSWINKPNYLIRAAVYFLIVLLFLAIAQSLLKFDFNADGINIAEFIQMIEAAIEGSVFIGAGIIFLITLETRAKRKKIIRALNKLRTIAHIIDAHQLTKDPDTITRIHLTTPHSPQRNLDGFLLGRYLDYCAEMLSLAGKLGFLYVQDFDDPESNKAANDLEDLTTDLSRKIMQKILILHHRQIGVNPPSECKLR
ncbi:hypothetical protein JW926_09415 [Candidatus Sumerlaeota bacterium]|nr:hypothetical protein [Candidatus Sumerlaeota bacterium]